MIPNYALAALNLIYQPEWTRLLATGGRGAGSHDRRRLRRMVRIRPDILVGGEARYFRQI